MMKKVVTIVGARPQFIKFAPLGKELDQLFNHIVVHTGQHFDENMSQVFFEQMNIREPDINLAISGGNHGFQTGQMLVEIEKVILDEQPNLVIVFGDTNSTLAGALAASKLHVPVLHIEAGLRSFDMKMPEEQNRVCVDHVSTYLSAPTEKAVQNLKHEGITKGVSLTGDIMVDSLNHFLKYSNQAMILDNIDLNSEFALLTMHRASNTDDEQILSQLIHLIEQSPIPVIFPVHPRTRKQLNKFNISPNKTIRLINPVGYLEMIQLLSQCKMVYTDSCGLQKEAYFLKKPCITLRNTTEWVETVEQDVNTLILDNNNTIDRNVFFTALEKDYPLTKFKESYGQPGVTLKIVDLIKSIL
jgi:UDP-N-acetylglucosamine 2-epimerase